MSYAKQLTLIAIANIVLIMMAVFAGIISINILNGNLAESTLYSFVLQNNSTADMMHDAIRSDVLMALDYSNRKVDNQEEMDSIKNDLKEHSETFFSSLEDTNKLSISSDILQKNHDVKPALVNYVNLSKEIIDLAFENHDLAYSKMNEFNKSFKDVEEKMANLGEEIETTSSKIKEHASDYAKTIQATIVVFAVFSVLGGGFLSYSTIKNNKKLQSKVSSTVNLVSKEALNTLNCISSVADDGDVLSTSANMQAASIEEASSTLQSISESAKSNVNESSKAYQLSFDGKKSTEEGKRIISTLIESMGGIKNTQKSIDDMLQLISEIGEKTKVINDIAIQTHILSFNAAIESARSGSAGKGFAVVAEEVRSLANRSNLAAKEIEHLITESTSKTDEISRTVSNSIGRVLNDVSKCEDVFSDMFQKVDTISSSLKSLLTASHNQFSDLKQVTNSVSMLDNIGMNTAKTAQSVAENAKEVRLIVGSLQNKIDELNIHITGT